MRPWEARGCALSRKEILSSSVAAAVPVPRALPSLASTLRLQSGVKGNLPFTGCLSWT